MDDENIQLKKRNPPTTPEQSRQHLYLSQLVTFLTSHYINSDIPSLPGIIEPAIPHKIIKNEVPTPRMPLEVHLLPPDQVIYFTHTTLAVYSIYYAWNVRYLKNGTFFRPTWLGDPLIELYDCYMQHEQELLTLPYSSHIFYNDLNTTIFGLNHHRYIQYILRRARKFQFSKTHHVNSKPGRLLNLVI